jgi:nucleoside phosphorylase
LKTTVALLAAAILSPSPLRADTAILVALPAEQSALSREVRIVGQPVELAQHRISIGYHKGEKLYIVRTGAGNLNSAMVTQALLTRYRIDRVISIGVAGNLAEGDGESGKREAESGKGEGQRADASERRPYRGEARSAYAEPASAGKPANDLRAGKATADKGQESEAESGKLKAESFQIGDIFIATEVVNHQEGKETPGGFEVKQGQPSAISHQRSAEYEQRCAELRRNAVEVAERIIEDGGPKAEGGGILERPQAGTPAPPDAEKLKAESRQPRASVRQGRLVSGESFIASTAKRKWLRETFKADAVDMVSAGIARVCEANGVPYVIIRVLSDNADESASAAFASFVQNYKEPMTVPVVLALVERFAAGSPVPAH